MINVKNKYPTMKIVIIAFGMLYRFIIIRLSSGLINNSNLLFSGELMHEISMESAIIMILIIKRVISLTITIIG